MRLIKLHRSICLFLLFALVPSCDSIRAVTSPIPTRFYSSAAGTERLVIFLPGLGDDMAAFERAGFIDMLRQSVHATDSIVADAHLGYYLKQSVDERIYQDILLPYERKGYSKFLVVGVSLGGLGAIQLKHKFANRIAGIVLFSPYLGNRSLVEVIQRSGGVRAWRRQLDHHPDRDEQIWISINDLIDPQSDQIPSTILAFGKQDKFESAAQMVAKSVPGDMTFIKDGGHTWATWSSLWAEILESEAWEDLGSFD